MWCLKMMQKCIFFWKSKKHIQMVPKPFYYAEKLYFWWKNWNIQKKRKNQNFRNFDFEKFWIFFEKFFHEKSKICIFFLWLKNASRMRFRMFLDKLFCGKLWTTSLNTFQYFRASMCISRTLDE